MIGTVAEVEREFIWLDIGGSRGKIYASELMLEIGERPADRYAVGDRFEAFVFQMEPDPESGETQFSIRRTSPYPESLADLEVGSEVQATVVNTYDAGIELDIGDLRGNIFVGAGLPLSVNESTHRRYQPGGQITARIHTINVEGRELVLAARQYAPGYLEALQRRAVGEVVSATVTSFQSNGGLWLDVDGLVGAVGPQELDLGDGKSAQDRYDVGDTIKGLFIQQINHEERVLDLSAKRNAPGYLEALQRRAVGEVVSATVTSFQSNGGLWLDVDGLVGAVGPQELDLGDGKSAQDRYDVGDTIKGLFVWQVNHEERDLALSAKRNAPSYLEALQRRAVGEIVSATVTSFQSNGGLWLDVDGLVGAVGPQELDLGAEESAQDRYDVGDTIKGLFVWQVNHEACDLALSVKRNAPGYLNALQQRAVGEIVSATVTGFSGNDGLWLDVDGLRGAVGPEDLDLNEGESLRGRYDVGDTIKGLFVWQVNHEARDLALSVKRNAPGYAGALQRQVVGKTVAGAVTAIRSGGMWLDVEGAIGWIFKEEASLEDDATLAERYSVGEPITAVVRHVDRTTRVVLLSARGIGSALVDEPIVQGAMIKALVVRERDGGIDVSVDGESEIYIPDYALSLRPGGSTDMEMGQEIDVVVMDVEDGVPMVLSHRRALDGWKAARDRLAAGAVVPDARVIPWIDRPNRDGRAAVDLGPVTGFIPLSERGADAAEDLMSRRANRSHGIVIEELDEDVWTASVSEAKFEARWRELVDDLPTNEGVEGEILDIARGVATLDLGFGLLGEMPASELPPAANGDAGGDARLGEVVKVGIRSVDSEEHRIAVESRAYRLAEMIADRESRTCEFKAVFQGRLEDDNPDVLSGYNVARAMAGMMNGGGGHVLIGVYEDRETKKGVVIGWEESGFETEDAFAIELSKVVGEMLTTGASGSYGVRFETLPSGQRIADIVCRPAERPIFTKNIRLRGAPAKFFVRYDGATRRPADDQELHNYIQERFYGRGTTEV